MVKKKPSAKTYRILETEGTHTVKSKETKGATRAIEFENGTNKLKGPVELVEVNVRTPKRYEDFSMGEQLVIDMAEIIVANVAEYLTVKAISSFENWLKNRREQTKKMRSEIKEPLARRKVKAELILETQKSKTVEIVQGESHLPSAVFDFVYKEYQINMTSEEVQKELIDIYMLEVIRARKIWKVSHAKIIDVQDFKGTYLEGKILIDRLSNPEILSEINALLESKPELLEVWETIALSDILGRDLVMNGQYIPIESARLKSALLESI